MSEPGFRVDERSVKRLFDNAEKVLRITLGLRRGVDLAEARSVELAPIDTGNLEAGFRADERRAPGKLLATFGFAPDYAAKVHEFPPDARGPRTRRKPGNQYGPAGPSYLLRAIRGIAGDGSLLKVIGEAYREALQRRV